MAKFINMDLVSMIIEIDEKLRIYFKDWVYTLDNPEEIAELKDILTNQLENFNWWCIG
jgi:hypothetical protein